MEVLSGVASGMAVVSLTVQLLQSANAIKTFIRDVKSASKELERLSESLDCLSALLTNVRDVMERQTSLQHCPLPSQTISDCLKSCQSSLGLLEETAKRYERKQGGSASALKKLKDDMTLIQYVVYCLLMIPTKRGRQTRYTFRSASL
jgi:hypothetical protein